MVSRTGGSGVEKLESLISHILIIGVVTSFLFELAGMMFFYSSYGSLAISRNSEMFLRGENFFIFLARLLRESPASWSIRLITLGIVILILTPYVRAILSVIYFASQRNFRYLAITLFVLMILTASLLAH